MLYQYQADQELEIDGVRYHIVGHVATSAGLEVKEGNHGAIYHLVAGDEHRALKVFKIRYRVPQLVSLGHQLSAFSEMTGLQVCRRTVLTARGHTPLLRQHPEMTFAVLMPWVKGPTWAEVIRERRSFTVEQSLALARSLAAILATMEDRRLAHCELSGANVLVPGLVSDLSIAAGESGDGLVALVDLEQVYLPGLDRPIMEPTAAPGYARKSAPGGLWAPEADRFAGAILLAEILGWCDVHIRETAWEQSYFAPEELQGEAERYRTLVNTIRENWGPELANLLEEAWRSATPAHCPLFAQWGLALQEVANRGRGSSARPPTFSASPHPQEVGLLELLSRLAEALAPPGTDLADRSASAGRGVEARLQPPPANGPEQPPSPIETTEEPNVQAKSATRLHQRPEFRQDEHARPRGFFAWLRWWTLWVLATSVGIVAGVSAVSALSSLSFDERAARAGLGAAMGFTQWLVLRRRLRAGWWIPATTTGSLVGELVAPALWNGAGFVISMSFGVGLSQWLVLRRNLRRAAWWIPASMIAWLVGIYMAPSTGEDYIDLAIIGAAVGLVTGIALVFLLSDSSPGEVELDLVAQQRGAPLPRTALGLSFLALAYVLLGALARLATVLGDVEPSLIRYHDLLLPISRILLGGSIGLALLSWVLIHRTFFSLLCAGIAWSVGFIGAQRFLSVLLTVLAG